MNEWERYADPLDQAGQVTQSHVDGQTEMASILSAPEQVRGEDGLWPITECVDCDNEIEAGRLELGKVRCLRCQALLEKKRKGYFVTQ